MQNFIIFLCFFLSFFNLFSQEWWRQTTVYQIYPRSFKDTNGDGIGDIKGIIEKLDYIKDLGFESIWISPFTESPQKDFGYDISDYLSISSEYGTIEDFENLVKEVHNRNMKIIFDMVMNHTSDEHSWFQESRSSLNNPKKDWYIWKNGKGKKGLKRPNNWRAMPGNRAWNYDSIRKQFYYSGFLPFQPDLNYNNPEVKKIMFETLKFWLDKGVDGFRLDIISAIYEDSTLKNNPISHKIMPSDEALTLYFQYVKNNFLQNQSFEFATELREVINKYKNPERFLVGESHGKESIIKNFCQYKNNKGLNAVFLFKAITTHFNSKNYKKMITEFELNFPNPLIPTLVFGNHDRTRSLNRLKGNIEKAKLLAFFQFTARGIPFVYYGEEIGMQNVQIPLKEGKDAIAIAHKKIPQFIANLSVETLNRDECRTPMLWNFGKNAGFCYDSIKPWLPISPNYESINVSKQFSDSTSLLNFYKKIIQTRKNNLTLQLGSMELLKDKSNKNLLIYYRIYENTKLLVILNISKKKIKYSFPKGLILFTSKNNNSNFLEPFEGRIIEVQ